MATEDELIATYVEAALAADACLGDFDAWCVAFERSGVAYEAALAAGVPKDRLDRGWAWAKGGATYIWYLRSRLAAVLKLRGVT